MEAIIELINRAWDIRHTLGPYNGVGIRAAIDGVMEDLDKGKLRVAEKIGDEWLTNQWVKKALVLSFRLRGIELVSGAPNGINYWDKFP